MNKALIIGRLENDAQFNENFESDPQCRFNLAVTERWDDDKSRTEQVKILATGADAKTMKTAAVGDLVYVKGLSKPSSYEKDGETIYYHEVESRRLQIIADPPHYMDENEVTLVGRLGGDPKPFKDGKVAAFSVACEDYNGKKQETRWINVITFDRLAKSASEYLAKGRLVAVEGKVRTREYEKDGAVRKSTSIVADRWTALDAKPKNKQKETDEIPFP